MKVSFWNGICLSILGICSLISTYRIVEGKYAEALKVACLGAAISIFFAGSVYVVSRLSKERNQ